MGGYISADVNGLEPDHQEASQKITLSNEIFANAEAVYHAGEEVVFTDGFAANPNSTFRAYIEGCTKDYGARKGTPEPAEVITYNNPYLSVATDEENKEPASHFIFPNPSSGFFSMKLGGVQSGSYEISDRTGRVYSSQQFENTDRLDINIGSYTPGIYLLKVKSGDSVIVQKMIKK